MAERAAVQREIRPLGVDFKNKREMQLNTTENK